MRLLVDGAQPWLTVLMVQGQHNWLITQWSPFSWYLCVTGLIMIYSLVAFGFSVETTGFFLAVQVKKGNPTLLNGMKVKVLWREPIVDVENSLWVSCNLIQQRIVFWLLVMIFPSSSGIWTVFNFWQQLMLMEASQWVRYVPVNYKRLFWV